MIYHLCFPHNEKFHFLFTTFFQENYTQDRTKIQQTDTCPQQVEGAALVRTFDTYYLHFRFRMLRNTNIKMQNHDQILKHTNRAFQSAGTCLVAICPRRHVLKSQFGLVVGNLVDAICGPTTIDPAVSYFPAFSSLVLLEDRTV